jgi:predicted DNA-binding WGR domain protein
MDMIYLERHDATLNMARYYRLTVEKNLFGEFSLVRTWGRIGKRSQEKIELHITEQDAQVAVARKVQQKQRKGYA